MAAPPKPPLDRLVGGCGDGIGVLAVSPSAAPSSAANGSMSESTATTASTGPNRREKTTDASARRRSGRQARPGAAERQGPVAADDDIELEPVGRETKSVAR
jgi:hypothetical protein